MSEILAQLAGAAGGGGAPPGAAPPGGDPFGGLPPSIPDPEAAAAPAGPSAPPDLGAAPAEAGPPPQEGPPAGGGDEVSTLKDLLGMADSYKSIGTVTEQERAQMEQVTSILQKLLASNEKMSQQLTGANPATMKAFGGPG